MTWLEAAERFGSDKPDVRFGLELIELTDVFASTGFNAFKAPCVKGIRVPGGAEFTRSRLDELTDKAKRWGAKGLVWMRVKEAGELDSPVAKFLSDDEKAALVTATGAETGDLLLIVADERPKTRHVLGLLRIDIGKPPVNEGGLNFLWVARPAVRIGRRGDGRFRVGAPPVTMPHEDDFGLLDGSPQELPDVRSQAYDLVLNGWERARASVRIHRGDIQQRVRAARHLQRGGAFKFGFRSTHSICTAAARRVRARHRPARRPAGGRGEHSARSSPSPRRVG